MPSVGRAVTRARLYDAVYQKVGLSRSESSALVELVLKEIADSVARGEAVKVIIFRNVHCTQEGSPHGPESENRRRRTDLFTSRRCIQGVGRLEATDKRRGHFPCRSDLRSLSDKNDQTRLHEQLKLSGVAIVVDPFVTPHRAQHDGTQQTLHLKASTKVRHGWARTER